MKMTFRWFGDKSDTVPLWKIRQIPAMTGLMGFLDYKAAGELWTTDEIGLYLSQIHSAGLECEVIESVNIHESIKMGLPSRDVYIERYIQTIRNLASFGVKVIIYNFMPVFDWLRTDLSREIPEDGSYSMYFDERDLGGMGPMDIVRRMEKESGGFSLPGWEPERMAELETTLKAYEGVSPDVLREHLRYFLNAVMPVCEECGVTLAQHPDDPAWRIFGLPRIAHSHGDFQKLCALHPSKRHSLCLCTGSLATNPENDIPALVREFGAQGRVACMHIRNIKHLGHRQFRESSHLSQDGDLDMYAIVKAVYDSCPDVYVRPDHGRMIWNEAGRPGYGLYDRALGVMYLNGLWEAIERADKG